MLDEHTNGLKGGMSGFLTLGVSLWLPMVNAETILIDEQRQTVHL